jgi:DNA (cytosine-5)-methyltransferase 1
VVFDEVQTDLENEGYKVIPFLLPSCGIGAIHQRERIWFIAYSEGYGNYQREKSFRGTNDTIGIDIIYKFNEQFAVTDQRFFESAISPDDHGFSERLDGIAVSEWRKQSRKAAGNAIVPQVAYQIFKAIEQYEILQSPSNNVKEK